MSLSLGQGSLQPEVSQDGHHQGDNWSLDGRQVGDNSLRAPLAQAFMKMTKDLLKMIISSIHKYTEL